MRLAPLSILTGVPLDFSLSDPYDSPSAVSPTDAFSQVPFGTTIQAAPMDRPVLTANVANWGSCELMWVRHAGAAIAPGRLVHIDKDFTILDVPVTGNTGRPVYVTLTNFAVGSVTPQAGWVLAAGICPVQFGVAATIGAVFGGASGVATPTPAAGRQILNATTLIAGAAAFTRPVRTQSGSPFVRVNTVIGNYVGQAISGAGIPGGTTIATIGTAGDEMRLSANCTASGSPTATFTNTGFGIVMIDRAFIQGQIA